MNVEAFPVWHGFRWISTTRAVTHYIKQTLCLSVSVFLHSKKKKNENHPLKLWKAGESFWLLILTIITHLFTSDLLCSSDQLGLGPFDCQVWASCENKEWPSAVSPGCQLLWRLSMQHRGRVARGNRSWDLIKQINTCSLDSVGIVHVIVLIFCAFVVDWHVMCSCVFFRGSVWVRLMHVQFILVVNTACH